MFEDERRRYAKGSIVAMLVAGVSYLTMLSSIQLWPGVIVLIPVCAMSVFWCVLTAWWSWSVPPPLTLVVSRRRAEPESAGGDVATAIHSGASPPRRETPPRPRIYGALLSRRLAELDLRTPPGEPVLSGFVAPRLAHGIARHDPNAVLAVVDGLRERGEADPELEVALEGLAAALRLARDQEMTCCLIPLGGWSALIDERFHVHLFAW